MLFGTDWPICNVTDHVHLVQSLAIADEHKEMILSGNASRLFPRPTTAGPRRLKSGLSKHEVGLRRLGWYIMRYRFFSLAMAVLASLLLCGECLSIPGRQGGAQYCPFGVTCIWNKRGMG